MKLPCYIVEDLLPSYVDGCTARETAILVKEHLETCTHCRAMYEAMTAPVAQTPSEAGEIDYLKSIRRQNFWKSGAAVLLTCLVVLAMILAKVYVIGSEVNGVVSEDIWVENGCVYAMVELPEDQAFLSYEVEKQTDGSWKVVFRGAKESLFHRGNTRQVQIPLDGLEQYLYIGDYVITAEGRILDQVVVSMVDARVTYVGNAWQVNRLLQQSGISALIGNFSIRLQTGMEPYSILVSFYEKEFFSDAQKAFLEQRGRMILACIGNCNEIQFESGTETFSVQYEEKVDTYKEMEKLMDAKAHP